MMVLATDAPSNELGAVIYSRLDNGQDAHAQNSFTRGDDEMHLSG